jgi:AcrR family transcriptional regulator
MSTVSPRIADPELRARLIESAARILAEQGPLALSTRRLAAAVGTSTMAVYTHFGGMDDLVRTMVHEGFERLSERMNAVQPSADPVADVAALGAAYRANAQEHQHLYAVMFGGSNLGGFALTDDDRQFGRYTLGNLVGAVTRCMEQGRFRPGDPYLVAHQMWIALHGLVTLELGGYLVEPYDADTCFESQVRGLMVGAGDEAETAANSVEAARERGTAERGAHR